MLKTDEEEISVHSGPLWYIENQDTKIETKDKIEVAGSRFTFERKPAIIAAEVKKGDKILKLREEKGFFRFGAAGDEANLTFTRNFKVNIVKSHFDFAQCNVVQFCCHIRFFMRNIGCWMYET